MYIEELFIYKNGKYESVGWGVFNDSGLIAHFKSHEDAQKYIDQDEPKQEQNSKLLKPKL